MAKHRGGSLASQLLRLRPALASAAQKILDAWVQDDESFDDEYGGGGPCDEIARVMQEIISELPNVRLLDGGQDGSDHAFTVVLTDTEACTVDIPPGVYETGGGYSWKKREGARVEPDDVLVEGVPRNYFSDEDYD